MTRAEAKTAAALSDRLDALNSLGPDWDAQQTRPIYELLWHGPSASNTFRLDKKEFDAFCQQIRESIKAKLTELGVTP